MKQLNQQNMQPSSVTIDADRYEDQKENIMLQQNALQYTLQQAQFDSHKSANQLENQGLLNIQLKIDSDNWNGAGQEGEQAYVD